MLSQIEIKKKWFVGNRVEGKILDGVKRHQGYFNTSAIYEESFKNFHDIPEHLQEDTIIFTAYSFEIDGKPILITKNKNTEFRISYHCFYTEREAKKFLKQLEVDMMCCYFDEEDERENLKRIGYKLEEDEDITELSIHEGREWNEFLEKWYASEFEGLGYDVVFDGETFEI